MSDPLRSITVFPTIAVVESSFGPRIVEYGTCVDRPVLFRFAPNDTSTGDSWTTLEPSGGGAGMWLDVPEDDLGANLADGNATITVAGKKRRRLASGTLTDNRTATLGTTNARAGHQLIFSLLDNAAFTYAIVNGGPGAGTLATKAAGEKRLVHVYFDDTNWVLLDSHAIT